MRFVIPAVPLLALLGLTACGTTPPAPATTEAAKPAKPISPVAAANMANNCFACHGPNGTSPPGGTMPSLHLLTADNIADNLRAFKSNARPSTVMGRHAKAYSDAEITALANYIGGLNRK